MEVKKGQRDRIIHHWVCEYLLMVVCQQPLNKQEVMALKRLVEADQIGNFWVAFEAVC